ncbi:MAG: hypothetical protein LBB80_08025, partial [Treponema sp.]|nr:hypothetical protein [Treponema sp.]
NPKTIVAYLESELRKDLSTRYTASQLWNSISEADPMAESIAKALGVPSANTQKAWANLTNAVWYFDF